MKIKTKEQYNEMLKNRKPKNRESLPMGKKKTKKPFTRKAKSRNPKPYKAIHILKPQDIEALRKKQKKLEKKYEDLKGVPLVMARIEKTFLSIAAKLKPYRGEEED